MSAVPNNPPLVVQHWLPTDPPRPAPDLMTPDEACAFLRLGAKGRNAKRQLEGLRDRGEIKCIRAGAEFLYPRANLLKFIERKLAE